MPFSFVVHKDLRLVISSGYDCLSWSEIKDCQDLTRTDSNFNPVFNQIVDLRSVTGFDMTTEHARVLARRRIFSFASKRAFVVSRPAEFGMVRMWETFTELSDNPSQIQIFYDLSLALKWLKLASLPPMDDAKFLS